MSEPIAQRTLVKSPPELWAEISDVEALARHLGAFGEIRITRVVPETAVSWEGETARGTVELSAAGWGTKVTLRATPTGAAATSAAAPVSVDPAPAAHVDGRPPAITALTRDEHTTEPPRGGEPVVKPGDATHWAESVEQKVRDRYVGGAPSGKPGAGARTSAPATPAAQAQRAASPEPGIPSPQATEPASTRRGRDDRGPRRGNGGRGGAPTTQSPATKSPFPPRGFLARLRWWFGAPSDDVVPAARSGAPAAEPAPAPIATEPAPTPVAADPRPLTVIPIAPRPVEQPRPATSPQTLPPAAVREPAQPATAPPLVQPAATPPPAPAAATSPEPAAAAPVDEGTIVGILTGVLDELGSARHRPFSRD